MLFSGMLCFIACLTKVYIHPCVPYLSKQYIQVTYIVHKLEKLVGDYKPKIYRRFVEGTFLGDITRVSRLLEEVSKHWALFESKFF